MLIFLLVGALLSLVVAVVFVHEADLGDHSHVRVVLSALLFSLSLHC
jgi:hypothetical protein